MQKDTSLYLPLAPFSPEAACSPFSSSLDRFQFRQDHAVDVPSIYVFFLVRNPSEVAVRQAKINVIRNYLLVGVTEELEDFLFSLEALLPEFFKGVLNVYKTPG